MADNYNFDEDRLADAILRGLRDSGRVDFDPKDVKVLMENLKKLDKEVKAGTTTYKGLFKEMITGKRVYKDMSDAIKSLDKQIEDLADVSDNATSELKRELIERRNSVQLMQQHNAKQRAVVESMTSFTKAATVASARGVGTFVKGLQDGSSAFSLASGAMETALDVATAGTTALGQGMQTVGGAAMMSGKVGVKRLGVAAIAGGLALEGLSSAANAAGKAVLGFMKTEMEKTIEGFQKMAAGGAVFSGGMTEMRYAAEFAGLTVQQMAEVIGKQSDNLAASGAGVSDAIKMVGRVGYALRSQKLDERLLKLGFGFTEQAEITAEVIADLRRADSAILKDPQKVAQLTAEYAQNLRAISAFTGEDARKKMEETRRANSQVAFRLKMMELEKQFPGITERTQLSMSNMTEQMQQNVRESVVFGGTINQVGAMLESSSDGYAGAVKGVTQSILDGSITTEKAQRMIGSGYDQFRKDIQDGGVGMAVGMAQLAQVQGPAAELGKALTNEMLASDKRTIKSAEASQQGAQQQGDAADELTQSYVSASKAAQQMAVDLQAMVLPALKTFSIYASKILNKLKDALGDEGIGGTLEEANQIARDNMTWQDKMTSSFWRGLDFINKGLDAVSGGAASGLIEWGSGGKSREQLRRERMEREAGAYGVPFTQSDVQRGAGSAGVAISTPGGVTGSGAPVTDANNLLWGDQGPSAGGAKTKTRGMGITQDMNVPGASVYAGLNIKGRESVAGGAADPKLIYLANEIKKVYPDAVITAMNDVWHQQNRPGSKHTTGQALDLRFPFTPTVEQGKAIVETLRGLGFKYVLDEYNMPNGGTGGHIHAQLKDGGVTSGPSLAGEDGPEAVIPLPNGRSIPVEMDTSALVELLRDLLDVNKDNRDLLEKLFHASA